MATKINPPDLSSGNYELYKEKLLAWQMVTDIPVDKQGIVIALTLPNDDKHKIQEEVFSQIGREKLSQENGLDTLINFLDSKLMKDDLSDSLEKFEEFEDFQRVNGQNITEYIAAFDSRYRKMEKFKIKLPSEILAFKLLRRANISKEEKMLVLTGMNYANRETLYEEAKQSLKKFKGDITEGSISTAASVKLEPAFLAENEEALLAAGYYKQGQGKRSVRTGRGGYSRGGGQRGQGQEARRKMNPTGPDGKPLTCRVCGSYRHLMKDCPDSWENINEGTGSTGAYIVWLMDNTGQCCPIAWNAHKIKRVVRSTLAAETLGLEEGLEASYYYREMLASILGVKPRTVMIEAYVDNKSIIEAILSTRLVEDKRLRVDVAAIKESLQLHDVKKIQWVPGHLQLANPMTKQGASGFNLLKVLQSGKMLDELC